MCRIYIETKLTNSNSNYECVILVDKKETVFS